MIVTVMKLADLRPMEKNVRRHNDKQITEYMRSLEKFQQIRPMVVDETGMILVGNGMFEAMKRMGWETGDCYIVTGLTDAEKTKLMLADNRVYELGMTDMDAFDDIIAGLDGDFDIPGWDDDLLETLTASMAEATEMVQNYGVFAPEEVRRVQDRERETHTEGVPAEPAYQPPQTAQAPAEEATPVPHREDGQVPTAPAEALPGRFIICPHCGERIPFTPDMIGGE